VSYFSRQGPGHELKDAAAGTEHSRLFVIEDPHHPRGYRELRSAAEMRKLLNRKIVEQHQKCAICHEEFTDYNDVVPDHKHPKGMGGAWRDDHPDNIQATPGGATKKKDQRE
jgi:hypothetical protein